MFQAYELCKSYHRRSVLNKISFCLEPGQCLGVVGDNGAGKSTLLSLLAQTVKPDSGTVRFQGRDILGDRAFVRRYIGYVPQSSSLLPEMTGGEMLRLWMAACDCREALPRQVEELLGIRELREEKISRMSGGMQQRISIAMALSTRPQILIMDEATTALDATYRENLLCYLEDHLRRGGQMVWCSHDAQEQQRLCRQILQL